jgi:hypothetical protein
MNPPPQDPSSRPTAPRAVPHFVPTLTEVVEDFEPPAPTMPYTSVDAELASPPSTPGSEPLLEAKALPVEAVVDEVVDLVLDRLLLRLTDALELHLDQHLAQWRDEQARAWAAGWVRECMDQELTDVREQVESLVREAMARLAPTDARLP